MGLLGMVLVMWVRIWTVGDAHITIRPHVHHQEAGRHMDGVEVHLMKHWYAFSVTLGGAIGRESRRTKRNVEFDPERYGE